jgi:putative hydrolase of the HAD superfamily
MQSSSPRVPKIQAVVLDYGQVLCFPPDPSETARIARTFGLTDAQFPSFYDTNRGLYDRGDLSPEEYWTKFAASTSTPLTPEKMAELRVWDVEMWSKVNPVMVDWLAALQAAKFHTALLSNMAEDMMAKMRRDFHWVKMFDHVVFSFDLRLAKPEAAIYERCLALLGAKPEETIFVDDREPNVRAARALGIHAIQFRSVAQLRQDLHKLGFSVLPSADGAAGRDVITFDLED